MMPLAAHEFLSGKKRLRKAGSSLKTITVSDTLLPLESMCTTGTTNWELHLDNALCHSAIVVQQLLVKFGVATLPHLSPLPSAQTWLHHEKGDQKTLVLFYQGNSKGNDKGSHPTSSKLLMRDRRVKLSVSMQEECILKITK
ncbi:hypothetical protein J6590_023316 [Homalodisca vitripennis]|nr:hypothetical protein J6590_023316 [Homalodisca vitripennis]